MMRFSAIRPVLAFAAASMASAAMAAEPVSKIDTLGEWSLYADGRSPHQFCFVTSEPKTSEPQAASRDAPRAYVSAWPADGVKGEVSFRMGFAIKKDSEAAARINAADFRLFGSGDRAFVKDSMQELKLVEAMKKGAQLTIAATSERGTNVTDTYALTGLGQALQKLQQSCF